MAKVSDTRCVVCGRSMADEGVIELHRVNKTGQPGVWACREHVREAGGPEPDPTVLDIVDILAGDRK